MAEPRDFHHRLGAYVEGSAGGNKTLAARQLGITRLQIHRYLGKAMPRRERLQRLESIFAASRPVPEHAENPDIKTVSYLLETIRYLERLVADDLRRGKPSSES